MASKYANLPDIDSAPDVYETPDVYEPQPEASSEDESNGLASTRPTEVSREDLDSSRLPSRQEVGQKFRKAERRRPRTRTVYAYPPSPDRSPSRSPSPGRRPLPLKARLRALQHELSALETELADPTNPLLLTEEGSADTGEMMRGLVEVRGRLSKLGLGEGQSNGEVILDRILNSTKAKSETAVVETEESDPTKEADISSDERATIAEVDKRLGELEKLVGSSSMYLDESSPLPQPLLPHITRLSSLLTLLTQPRHIDSISRRLKLLLTDLERYSASTARRQQSAQPGQAGQSTTQPPAPLSTLPQDIVPLLSRLSTSLPMIPHLLTRLRTLSNLHTSASSFASTLSTLEADQVKVRSGLEDLERAVEGMEKSLDANGERIEGNLRALVGRLDEMQLKIAAIEKSQSQE